MAGASGGKAGQAGTTKERVIFDQITLLCSSDAFDPEWYLQMNPDVRGANADAAEHYVRWGASEGRVPAPGFDANWYRTYYKDVDQSGFLPYLHFIEIGQHEGRSPNRRSDVLSRATLRINDSPPFARPMRLGQGAGTKNARIAIVIHIFYIDIWPEIQTAINNVKEPFDIFVSLVSGASEELSKKILTDFPHAQIYVYTENRGRDIAPFLQILYDGKLFKYEIVCKIHSKRSNYVVNGDAWRQSLIEGILGTEKIVDKIARAFRSDPGVGVVVAPGNIYSGSRYWDGNEDNLEILLRRCGMSVDYKFSQFPGGSIYWIRPIVLAALRGINISLDDFEPEPLPNNGTLAHAIERLIGCICENLHLKIHDMDDLLD